MSKKHNHIPEINSLNPELQVSKIILTDHAYTRVAERLGIKDRSKALGHIRNILRQAKRIGTVYGADGKEGVQYAFNKLAIVLSPDLVAVVTIKMTDEVSHPKIKSKIVEWHRKEFNKLNRLEQSRVRKLHIERLRITAEVAQLEYRKVKSRSANVRKYCNEQIPLLLNEIARMEEEIQNIRAEKRIVANSMSAII